MTQNRQEYWKNQSNQIIARGEAIVSDYKSLPWYKRWIKYPGGYEWYLPVEELGHAVKMIISTRNDPE